MAKGGRNGPYFFNWFGLKMNTGRPSVQIDMSQSFSLGVTPFGSLCVPNKPYSG
jgi:hypothetical protein